MLHEKIDLGQMGIKHILRQSSASPPRRAKASLVRRDKTARSRYRLKSVVARANRIACTKSKKHSARVVGVEVFQTFQQLCHICAAADAYSATYQGRSMTVGSGFALLTTAKPFGK